MKLQHSVYLSIGSNLGKSHALVQDAVDTIHKNIATVVAVSDSYLTRSWGFEGNDFLNVVVKIHTQWTLKKLFKKLQQLEKDLGRIKLSNTYENRVIDIDIVSFDDHIVNEDDLVVPHPRLHLRDFVLKPLSDIAPKWQHPVSKSYVMDLLKQPIEQTIIKKTDRINLPLPRLQNQHLKYLVLEGNIGAGKTTLATKISEDFNAKLVLERFADNPFLPKFYSDKKRYAFPLEMSFLADRYKQVTDDLAQFDLFKDFLVSDYHILKSLIFAQVTLQEDEIMLYRTMFDIIHKDVPKPDAYIYLYQSTDSLLMNIKKRGRSYEQNMDADYLNQINERYFLFFKTMKDFPVHVIDITYKDFVKNQSDYISLLTSITEMIR